MFDYPNCKDPQTYIQVNEYLEEFFHKNGHTLKKVTESARKIQDGFEKISPLIQHNTERICPECTSGYYLFEDLIYLYALGRRPADCEFGREEMDPCQFLSQNGCSIERPFRPSGCTWYFCDPLLEYMEKRPYYHEFDELLRDIAELWMEMMEEFLKTSPPRPA